MGVVSYLVTDEQCRRTEVHERHVPQHVRCGETIRWQSHRTLHGPGTATHLREEPPQASGSRSRRRTNRKGDKWAPRQQQGRLMRRWRKAGLHGADTEDA